MNQLERIYTMIQFINNRSYFTLRDLMEEFNISKSTALRDVQQIESLGLPLVADVGRNGGYSIMRNSLLPPLRFTPEELQALFLSLIATKNQQLPFLKSRQSLTEKVLGLVNETEQSNLVELDALLAFEQTNVFSSAVLELSDQASVMTEKVLQAVLQSRYVVLKYAGNLEKNEQLSTIEINAYVRRIFHQGRSWVLQVIDLKTNEILMIGVELVQAITPYTPDKDLSETKLVKKANETNKGNLVISVGRAAIEQYNLYHPTGIGIVFLDAFQNNGRITAKIEVTNANQIAEFVSWYLFLGESAKLQAAPIEFRDALKTRVHSLVEISD